MKFNEKFAGVFFGVLAAVTYGTNPFFGLRLYERGLTTSSVLFYRFFFATVILGILVAVTRNSFRLEKRQLLPMISGGIFVSLSCLFFFASFHHLDGGISATVLFVYPLMVAAIMYLFFHVKQSFMTIIGMAAAIGGIALLSLGNTSGKFSTVGLILVLLSALSYAIYMVQVKVTSLHKLPPLTLTFYAIACGIPFFLIALRGGLDLQKLPDYASGVYALGGAILPTVLSFLFMAIAIKYIGPTKTAIMGALEPVTALLIGITIFGETLSHRQLIGVTVILLAVSLVIAAKPPRNSTLKEEEKD